VKLNIFVSSDSFNLTVKLLSSNTEILALAFAKCPWFCNVTSLNLYNRSCRIQTSEYVHTEPAGVILVQYSNI